MTDQAALARHVLDLWEAEWERLAADPAVLSYYQSWLRQTVGAGDERRAGDTPTDAAAARDPDRPSAAGPASGPGDAGLDELRRRVAALERRLGAERPARD